MTGNEEYRNVQGFQQQLDAYHRMNKPRPSQLVAHCTDKWAFGNEAFSATEIQVIMEAAVADGCHHPEVELIAQIGCSGKHPQNSDRDLREILVEPMFHKAASTIEMPLKDPKTPNGVRTQSQTVLWPHLVFATLFNHYRDAFNERFLGGAADGSILTKFWNAVKGSSLYQGHPITKRADHKQRAVPISLFGDGVPVKGVGKSWGTSSTVYSFSGLLNSKGFSILAQILIFFFMDQLTLEESSDIFWDQLMWSFQWLEMGRHPTHGPPPLCEKYETGILRELAGTLLASGYYCVLWLTRADLDHYSKVYALEAHGSNHPCFLCQANAFNNQFPWTDFRTVAAYLATIWTNVAWKLARPNRHKLFRMAGMGVQQAQPDTMHTKHGGVDAYFYGSVMKYIIDHLMVGEAAAKLKRMWALLSGEFGKRHPSNQFTGMTFGMFDRGADQFPLMKGRASQIKNLGPVLFAVWKTFADPMQQAHRFITKTFEATLKMDAIIDATADEFVMNDNDADLFLKACRDYLQGITALRQYFQANHPTLLLFHITIKCHF
jgi:hypothetical protein